MLNVERILEQVERALLVATEEGITEERRLANVCLVLSEMRCDLEVTIHPRLGLARRAHVGCTSGGWCRPEEIE